MKDGALEVSPPPSEPPPQAGRVAMARRRSFLVLFWRLRMEERGERGTKKGKPIP